MRASVALKRGLAVTKNKARDLGIPFRSEAEMKKDRKRMFQNSTDCGVDTAPALPNNSSCKVRQNTAMTTNGGGTIRPAGAVNITVNITTGSSLFEPTLEPRNSAYD